MALKSALVGLLFLTAFSAAFSQTQSEMNISANNDARKSDAQLNAIYKRILNEYSHDTLFINKLKAAQRAWVAFRDAHIESIYPDTSRMTYGSANPMCRALIIKELTDQRIKVLQQWIDGIPEGDVCSGSIRIK